MSLQIELSFVIMNFDLRNAPTIMTSFARRYLTFSEVLVLSLEASTNAIS